MSAPGNTTITGPWPGGCDSWSDSTAVGETSYRWANNIVSRGGLPRTRPGLSCLPVTIEGTPRGLAVFTDYLGKTHMVAALGQEICKRTLPSIEWSNIPEITFKTNGPVVFETAIQNVEEADDGTLTVIQPKPILMMSDGETRTAFWDGVTARHLDPTKFPDGPSEAPVFKWMKWTGNRLWGSNGSRLRASNLLNPTKFTEEDILAESGALNLPADITGLGQTADFKNLLVFTDQTTSAISSSVLDRTAWALTNGFQQVIFPNIGCAAGKSIVTQYGITWWYAHGGLVGIDQALQTYRTSRMHFQDQAMSWSKENMSPDISGICCGAFENYLMVSVPSGDIHNAHTWVMDQSWALEQAISDVYSAMRAPTWNGLWKGIRPVEWVTTTLGGQSHCYVLSNDYPRETSGTTNNVWEAFGRDRMDVSRDNTQEVTLVPISCSLETRVMVDPHTKDFRYIEIDCEGISGVVNISVSFAPLRGGYKLVMAKQVVASQWTVVNGQTTIEVDTFEFDSYRPQSRILRAVSDQPLTSDDGYCGVESLYPRQTDFGFSVLVEWTGQMGVRAVRLTTDANIQETEGRCEADEETDRHVQMSGAQSVEETTPPTLVDGLSTGSSFVGSSIRTWIEPEYSSLV